MNPCSNGKPFHPLPSLGLLPGAGVAALEEQRHERVAVGVDLRGREPGGRRRAALALADDACVEHGGRAQRLRRHRAELEVLLQEVGRRGLGPVLGLVRVLETGFQKEFIIKPRL